jgi:BirA family biotin operon repressor/biotin-[acetyl-CoA-carboxylase] ligase
MYKILANTVFLGKDIHFMTECHSTNDLAMEKIKRKEVSEGSIVITQSQTKGRGQRGSQWWTEPGKNLTFSLILRPVFLKPHKQFELSKIVCLALWETLSALDSQIKIKWPNDLLHQSQGKICGVLIENIINQQSVEFSIMGIGLNVNQLDFPFPGVSSLKKISGEEIDLNHLLSELVSKIEKWYLLLKRGDYKFIHGQYLGQLLYFQEWASYNDGETFEGKIIGVNEEGKIIVEKRTGEQVAYGIKEVKLLA